MFLINGALIIVPLMPIGVLPTASAIRLLNQPVNPPKPRLLNQRQHQQILQPVPMQPLPLLQRR